MLFRFWVFPDCTFLDISKKQREKTTTYANKKTRNLAVSGLFGTP